MAKPADIENRRSFLLLGAGAGIGSVVPQSAQAQSGLDIRRSFSELVEAATEEAELAVDVVTGLTASPFFADPQFRQAGGFEWIVIADGSRSMLAEISSSDGLMICRLEHFDLASDIQEIAEQAVPIDEETDFLRWSGIVGINEESDTLLDVLLDIILDTFGIPEAARDVFAELLSDEDGTRLLSEIAEAVRGEDWSGLSRHSRQLLASLLGRNARQLLRERLDTPVFHRVILALGSRAVPYLGWALMAGNLVVSLLQNRDRILELLDER